LKEKQAIMENVNVIKLNESTIEIDGVVYEKKAEQPVKFKVGDWVIGIKGGTPIAPSRVFGIKGNELQYYYWAGNKETPSWMGSEWVRLATHSEIESHLKGIVRGKYQGVVIKEIRTGCLEHTLGNGLIRFYSTDDIWTENNDGATMSCVYDKGMWAEIIPEKKKLPKTKEEFGVFIGDWQNRPFQIDLYKFLDNYED
jgi:hypothetical protein